MLSRVRVGVKITSLERKKSVARGGYGSRKWWLIVVGVTVLEVGYVRDTRETRDIRT